MRHIRCSACTQRGFTFYELMIVVVIVAIGAVLALPSFTDAIERNRIASQTNELMAALSFARTEAIRSNATIGVCGLNAAKSGCDASNWNRGWLIYRPAAATGGSLTVLRMYELSPKDQLTGAVDVRFGPRGQRVLPAAGAAALTMKPISCAAGKNFLRNVNVTVTGASSHSAANCT